MENEINKMIELLQVKLTEMVDCTIERFKVLDELSLIESKTKIVVSEERDADTGKPRYTNENTRDSALQVLLRMDDSYQRHKSMDLDLVRKKGLLDAEIECLRLKINIGNGVIIDVKQ